MRLIRYGDKGREKPGIEIDGIRFDCSKMFKDWDREFFNDNGIQKLEEALKSANIHQVREIERVASPIARPGMIICVGLNYADHAEEAKMKPPSEPILFMKASNTIAGAHDKVPIPKDSEAIDYELELGVIVGKDSYQLESEAAAEDAIAGYTIVNDVSERDYQIKKGGQWVKGKSSPGFCPTGPCIVTKDEIADINNLALTLKVNDEVRQNSNTSAMIFSPQYLVKYISQFMRLEAGDLICTGTPSGVALGMEDNGYLKKGDLVDLEIEGIGTQSHMFV